MSELLLRGSADGTELDRGRPRRSGRPLRVLAVALIVLGALVLADAVVTLLWQEPISALYATIRQDRLSGALDRLEHAAPTPAERHELASLADERARIAFLAGEMQRHAAGGSAIGRIVIPRIGASFVLVNGTSTDELKSGPGVYPETSFPGAGRTTAVAGHRTTYLAPFRHIDALSPGSAIRMDMPYGEFSYSVIGQRVVAPSDVQAAVADVGYSRLVLSACTPLFSAEKRLLVFARLVRTVPRGAARQLPGGAVPQPIEGPETPRARRLPGVLIPLDPDVLSPIA